MNSSPGYVAAKVCGSSQREMAPLSLNFLMLRERSLCGHTVGRGLRSQSSRVALLMGSLYMPPALLWQ